MNGEKIFCIYCKGIIEEDVTLETQYHELCRQEMFQKASPFDPNLVTLQQWFHDDCAIDIDLYELKYLRELVLPDHFLLGGTITIPKEIKSLEYLQKLEIFTYPEIQELPVELSELHNLVSLRLDNMNIHNLDQILQLLPNLKELRLSNMNLHSIPLPIFNLQNLEILDLGNNELTYINDSFGKLSNLQYLDLTDNNLSEIPSSFFYLPFLEQLFLRNNKIQILPKNIEALQSLRLLELSNNCITYLPEEIGKLANLEILSLKSPIKSIPESIGQLQNLKKLIIISKKLKLLPKTIINLKKLELLIVDSPVAHPPIFFKELPNLETLRFMNNRNAKKLKFRIRRYYDSNKSYKKTIECYELIKKLLPDRNKINFRFKNLSEDQKQLIKMNLDCRVEFDVNRFGYSSGITISFDGGIPKSFTIKDLDSIECTSAIPKLEQFRKINYIYVENSNITILNYFLPKLKSLQVLRVAQSFGKIPINLFDFKTLHNLQIEYHSGPLF